MFGKLLNAVVDGALQPVRDTVDIVDGLMEGKIREEAIKRVTSDIVIGAATGVVASEIIDVVKGE